MSETDASGYEQRLGEYLRSLRLARGLNQGEVARMLTERGVSFRQQTVVKVEKGQRPLRLREAAAFADVLGVTLDALADPYPDRVSRIVGAMREVEEAHEAIRGAAVDLQRAQQQLARVLEAEVARGIVLKVKDFDEALAVLTADPVEAVSRACVDSWSDVISNDFKDWLTQAAQS